MSKKSPPDSADPARARLAVFPQITLAPHDPRLPPGLWLAGDARAALLPDGRALPLDLPPALLAQYAPDLCPPPADLLPPPPAIAEV